MKNNTKTTQELKTQMSQELKESLRDLLIDYMQKYPQLKKETIFKELGNHAYFLNRNNQL